MRLKVGMAAVALAGISSHAARAQGPTPAPAATSAAVTTVDPVAVQALAAMGAYLKTLKAFELRSNATIETSMDDTDLKVTLGLENLYRVERPNRFFISVKSDRQQREFFYDGKNFTVNVPRQNFYAVAAAPPTITGVVEDVYENFGITLPLSDIFAWADAGAPTKGIKSAVRVGYAKVGGVDTDQFAFRGDSLDFQIWIARGARPLPQKIVITARDDTARPSYSAELSWNTNARFTASTFVFKPDAKASAIQMARLSPEEK